MSSVCPKCGSSQSRSRGGLFSSSRVCRNCLTRYTRPTPLWERLLFAAVFLVPGLVLGILAVGIILLLMLGSERPNQGSQAAAGLGCSGFLGILAIFCLAQGFRELAGQAKRPDEESSVDSPSEFGEAPSRECTPSAPPLVPKEQAESLVREIAQRHKAKGIQRKLGHFRADHLANATARFAQQMREDETPLAFVDTSLLRNGKAGFLLTNRGLYSSWLRRPVWLADIDEVSYAKPEFTDFLTMWLLGWLLYVLLFGMKSLQHRLVVNGKTVCAGTNLRAAFWIELLTALAEAAREVQSPSPRGIESRAAPTLIVLEVSLCPRAGQPIDLRRVRDPVWQQIEQSIRDLDQDSYPWVRLWAGEPDQGRALEILGGNGTYALRELGDGWVYYDPSRDEEEIEVCTGTASYRCPAFYVCNDLGRVLKIVHHYFVTGTPE
jgi:hypothetical protein